MKPAKRDFTEKEKEIMKQKQKQFLDELLEEEAEVLALFISKIKEHKKE